MTTIQDTIQDYLSFRQGMPDAFTLRCFVGMIETKDATYADFKAVGGQELVQAVSDAAVAVAKRHIEECRK